MSMDIINVGGFYSSALSISASGLRDANLRLHSATHNTANINTDQFIPSRVTSQELQGGGVESIIESSSLVQEPLSTPYAVSQTSLIDEQINTIIAQQAFEANATALKVANEFQKSIIDDLA